MLAVGPFYNAYSYEPQVILLQGFTLYVEKFYNMLMDGYPRAASLD